MPHFSRQPYPNKLRSYAFGAHHETSDNIVQPIGGNAYVETSRLSSTLNPCDPGRIHAASLQFVRKITGFNKPSKANEAAFLAAVDAIAAISGHLLSSLETNAPPKNRAEVAAKARARAV
jgi:hypothetical protein